MCPEVTADRLKGGVEAERRSAGGHRGSADQATVVVEVLIGGPREAHDRRHGKRVERHIRNGPQCGIDHGDDGWSGT